MCVCACVRACACVCTRAPARVAVCSNFHICVLFPSSPPLPQIYKPTVTDAGAALGTGSQHTHAHKYIRMHFPLSCVGSSVKEDNRTGTGSQHMHPRKYMHFPLKRTHSEDKHNAQIFSSARFYGCFLQIVYTTEVLFFSFFSSNMGSSESSHTVPLFTMLHFRHTNLPCS